MTYATLMVHMELGRPNAALLRVAGDLAEKFSASVTGIAVCQPMRVIYSEGYVPGDLIAEDRIEREAELATAEAEFRESLRNRAGHLEWRSAIVEDSLSDFLCREARSADLVVTGADRNASFLDNTRHLDIGDFVMHVGRPVLIVPAVLDQLKFDRVLVGWKNSRETRRAVADALPFLKLAAHVVLLEIATEQDLIVAHQRLDGVRQWLARHGVAAETVVAPSTGEDAHQLHALALEHRAEIIVAGAYGHSRVREWVLGGVTRDLLLRAGRCSLVSH